MPDSQETARPDRLVFARAIVPDRVTGQSGPGRSHLVFIASTVIPSERW